MTPRELDCERRAVADRKRYDELEAKFKADRGDGMNVFTAEEQLELSYLRRLHQPWSEVTP